MLSPATWFYEPEPPTVASSSTARAFFDAYPYVRADLLGGHLWSKGYYAVLVSTHRQCCQTRDYIRANRQRADLPLPMPLQAIGIDLSSSNPQASAP